MFIKYNTVLRAGSNVPWIVKQNQSLNLGNTYTTSLHVINSSIVKLGKITKACKVYRGISKGTLPDDFWRRNALNVRGGVEFGFMSTTRDLQTARFYALSQSKVGMIFEIEQGMVDRGADLSWLSQYPHEKEILFGPLTGLEMLVHQPALYGPGDHAGVSWQLGFVYVADDQGARTVRLTSVNAAHAEQLKATLDELGLRYVCTDETHKVRASSSEEPGAPAALYETAAERSRHDAYGSSCSGLGCCCTTCCIASCMSTKCWKGLSSLLCCGHLWPCHPYESICGQVVGTMPNDYAAVPMRSSRTVDADNRSSPLLMANAPGVPQQTMDRS